MIVKVFLSSNEYVCVWFPHIYLILCLFVGNNIEQFSKSLLKIYKLQTNDVASVNLSVTCDKNGLKIVLTYKGSIYIMWMEIT